MRYIYPDKDDKMTKEGIIQKVGEKYWDASERRVLNKIKKNVGKGSLWIDLGAGEGRLTSFFNQDLHFPKIIVHLS